MNVLPLAARQQFLQKGYALLPGVLAPETVQRVRDGAIASTTARARCFYQMPNLEELLKSSQSRRSDPLLNPLLSQLEKRKYLLRYYKQLNRKRCELTRTVRRFLAGRKQSDLSPEDLWKLSELVAHEARQWGGGLSTSTVHNDPQMLAAIDEYRANAWMTSEVLTDVLRNDGVAKAALATVAEIVGGVEKPVVFGDTPLLRPAFGNPVTYHCTAPSIGTRTNAPRNISSSKKNAGGDGSASAVTLLIFTYTPTIARLEPFVLENSHRFVREQYIHQVHPRHLFSTFLPLESHIPFALKQFYFSNSVVGRSLLHASQNQSGTKTESDAVPIGPGTVMAVDPHLLMGFGPNATWDDEVVYRLNVVSKDAKPFMAAPSWVRGWRTLPREVNYASPVVFPPLHT